MAQASDLIDRIAPMYRPPGRPAGYQRWTNLLFLHWPVSPYDLEEKIPPRLTLDTFDGKAWIGLVLFEMSGVRPRWFPALPGVSFFLETNVRTYVHLEGKDPGVYFFSLDASSKLAITVARRRWRLPYYHARMQFTRKNRRLCYKSWRPQPGRPGPGYHVEAEIGDDLARFNKTIPSGRAVPGTLEHFLVERYILYTGGPRKRLYQARVHHLPYPLCEAELSAPIQENLLETSGIQPDGDPQNVLFSEGVQVEVFSLKRLPSSSGLEPTPPSKPEA